MSEPESLIIYGAGAGLLSLTAIRFFIQELIAVIRLCKELVAEIRAPMRGRRLRISSQK